MDSDYSTPAAKYFDDQSLVLSGTREARDEAILWLSFRETEGTVDFAVYDAKVKEYTYQFRGDRDEDVFAFVKDVEDAYGTNVPATYAASVQKFLDLRDNAFGLSLTLSEPSGSCGQCGDSRADSIEAFYFPPLTPDAPASVGVDMSYGCYDRKTFTGPAVTKDDIAEAVDILEDAIDRAESENTKDEIDDFLIRLVAAFPEKQACAGFGGGK